MIARIGVLAVLVAATSVFAADKPRVRVKSSVDGIRFFVDGRHFTTYNLNRDGKLPKPFMFPVRGPDGTILTRKILKSRKNGDHVHHKGIWVAVDEVNHVRFWAEKGKIVTRRELSGAGSGNEASVTVTNDWKADDGTTVVTEKTTITVTPNRVIAYDISFKAGEKPVTFRDTKEGLFGFRMVHSMRESEGGQVVNSRGEKGTKNCWGKTADWIDYYGKVNGKTYGVAIFDHPKNFRKSRYHVRNYGLFSINPFGQKAYTRGKKSAQPYTIKPGGTLR
ncbi:MAG: PmoA family protein, partial [Planctomycetaceae bacterium]